MLAGEDRRGDRETLPQLVERHRPSGHTFREARLDAKLQARVDPFDVVPDPQRWRTTKSSAHAAMRSRGCGKKGGRRGPAQEHFMKSTAHSLGRSEVRKRGSLHRL